jgi:hypothetical protein
MANGNAVMQANGLRSKPFHYWGFGFGRLVKRAAILAV